MSPEEIKEHRKRFENLLFSVRNFLESARREGFPVWQLDIKEIEILLADFENTLLGVANVQLELEAKRPEFEAVLTELGERTKNFQEIHSEAEYEAAQRLRAEIVAHQQLTKAMYATLLDAIDQSYYRLISQEQRLKALCRLDTDTEGSA